MAKCKGSLDETELHLLPDLLDQRTVQHWRKVLLAIVQLSQLSREEVSLFVVFLGPAEAVLVLQPLFIG